MLSFLDWEKARISTLTTLSQRSARSSGQCWIQVRKKEVKPSLTADDVTVCIEQSH